MDSLTDEFGDELEKIKKDYKATTFACLCKLFRMVLFGWVLLAWLDVKGLEFQVGIILALEAGIRKSKIRIPP